MGAKNSLHQALSVLSELERMQNLTSDFQLEGCAILSRTNGALAPIRSVLEEKNYPLRLPLQQSFPLPRIREMLAFMGSLEKRADNTVTASEAMAAVAERTAGDMNIWTGMLLKFLESYREETFDAELPVGWMLDRLYEYLAEQRREKTIGEGIFLGTIHTAKGMEFSHVFILDGDWSTPRSRQAWEEERRILYVAMTRAKENLMLMKSAQRANPLLRDVTGGSILTRQSAVPLASCNDRALFRYEILGLGEIFMDYAGGFPPKHPIHTSLARLGTGSQVTLADTGESIDIKDGDNHTVGRLANEAAKTWRRRLETIEKVRVLAILQRTRKDPDEGILPYIKSESWELPLLEVVTRG
jgi:ATP-dependent DNA helicase RecQ